MAVRNVLVAYDGSEPSESALELAVRVASASDAHLTGLLTQPLTLHAAPEIGWIPTDVLEIVVERARESAGAVREQFMERCAALGMTGRVSFHAVDGAPDQRCAEFARTYDLVVIGQPRTDRWDSLHEPRPDEVALRSGRPVLVAPRRLPANALTNGAVLAWDGGRAGARALSDALATLLGDGALTVLHVGEDAAEVRQPGRDVMEHLSRHGIRAELLVTPRANRAIAEVVLETAELSGAGLLVMGAYEHSPLGEALFGGVTRDVLRRTKVPVLVAH